MQTSIWRSLAQARRIHDGLADIFHLRAGGLRDAHVIRAGSVAALAVDAFGERALK